MLKYNSVNSLEKKYLSYLSTQEIRNKPFHNKIGQLNDFYLPVCKKIYQNYKKNKKIKIIGLTGGQGAGKSTITQVLKLILEIKYNLSIVCFSIDDFYKTSRERADLAKRVNKLFKTRGVPGTHDTNFIKKIFIDLTKKKFRPVLIPRFDKLKDDRSPKKFWQKIEQQPNIIIFEGWCVGAIPQQNKNLLKLINILEKKQDLDLKWRLRVNKELKNAYKKIFDKINMLIFLKVPSFDCVYKWRLLQEKKLQLTSKGKKIMSPLQIREFIMYYERITMQMIKDLPHKAHAVLYLDKQHRFIKIKFN